MRKAQASILLESILILVLLVLILVFWDPFARTTFLAGVFKVEDTRLTHYCSSFLPILLGNEYIKSGDELTKAVKELNEFLGITDPRLYPDADYLIDKVEGLYGEPFALKSGFKVFNGTDISQADISVSLDIFSILGITASRGQIAACRFPLYGPRYTGYVNMSVII